MATIPIHMSKKRKMYSRTLVSATALDSSMLSTYDNLEKFIKIRTEMDRLMVSINCSHWVVSNKQRVHYLFMALLHLDNVEKEVRLSDVNEELLRMAKILEKISSLKWLIEEYIRLINSTD